MASSSKNKFGLSRTIRDAVKLHVRRRCGFGCVFCGCAIYEYHHFDPPFAKATAHEAKGITLLCGTCHGKVTRGIYPMESVKRANEVPFSKQVGYSKDTIFLGNTVVPVRIGTSVFHTPFVFLWDNQIVFGFHPPECVGGPVRLTALFTNRARRPVLWINANEWQVGSEDFDVKTRCDQIVISDAESGRCILSLRLNMEHEFQIEELHMSLGRFTIDADNTEFTITSDVGGKVNHRPSASHQTTFVNSEIGIWFKSTGQVLYAANFNGSAAFALS